MSTLSILVFYDILTGIFAANFTNVNKLFEKKIPNSAALGECAKDKLALKRIHELDGVRLLWSLLKHPSERVSHRYLKKIYIGQVLLCAHY